MLETFGRHFRQDTSQGERISISVDFSIAPTLASLQSNFGGTSFEDGLYRVINPADLTSWNTLVSYAFPEFEHRITCFAYDWLGRAFAIDSQRLVKGLPGVVMFEPGTGQALEIPCDLASFHDEELIECSDAALAVSFFREWLVETGTPPSFKQGIGYRKPLFLGGRDSIENLELVELEIYWDIAGQLIRKARGLPQEIRINQVTINDA